MGVMAMGITQIEVTATGVTVTGVTRTEVMVTGAIRTVVLAMGVTRAAVMAMEVIQAGANPGRTTRNGVAGEQTDFLGVTLLGGDHAESPGSGGASPYLRRDLRIFSSMSSLTRFASLPSAPVAQLDRVYDFGS
jgi:hypothetical protein